MGCKIFLIENSLDLVFQAWLARFNPHILERSCHAKLALPFFFKTFGLTHLDFSLKFCCRNIVFRSKYRGPPYLQLQVWIILCWWNQTWQLPWKFVHTQSHILENILGQQLEHWMILLLSIYIYFCKLIYSLQTSCLQIVHKLFRRHS